MATAGAAWMATEDGRPLEFFVPADMLLAAEMAPGKRIGLCHAIIDDGETVHHFAGEGDWPYVPASWGVPELSR